MDQLETAGQRLISALSKDEDPYALTVLIVEAARIADRLEKLDDLLSGEQTLWARLHWSDRKKVYEVYIDNALSEARQQATVLKHLLAEIHRQRAQIKTEPGDDDLAGL